MALIANGDANEDVNRITRMSLEILEVDSSIKLYSVIYSVDCYSLLKSVRIFVSSYDIRLLAG